ncbi:MFS transporter [Leucobacter insecticola]|uniref:MFS transporter n=1 Tax=Leucobacter insecticola TaxID=2714934 RepID=A0A6G8FIN5_9MICO|nr:MFS transporter [Leucobacter insecticola]QIM16310.1 MFS transporter [Leucobacter insecticola]
MTPTPATRPRYAISQPRVLIVCAVSQLLVILDTSVLSVATPQIGSELGFSPVSLQLIANSYTAALAATILLMGRIADRFGRRRILVGGLVLFGFASLVGGLAPTQAVFLIARIFQGFASAGIVASNLALLVECFPEKPARLRAIGIWGAAGGSGGAIGALLGGIAVEHASWRVALLVNVPVVLTLLLGPMRRTGRDHITGGGATGSAGGFLIPTRLFKKRGVLTAAAIMFVGGGAIASAFYFITLHLQLSEGFGPLQTGLMFLPLSLAVLATGGQSTRIQLRLGARRALQLATLLMFFGLGITAALFAASLPLAGAFSSAIFGVGVSLVLSGTASVATGHVDPADAGSVSGMIATSQHFGAVLILAALVWLSTKLSLPLATQGEYLLPLLCAAAVCLIALLLTPGIPRGRNNQR